MSAVPPDRERDHLFRLGGVAFRCYARDPASRPVAARNMLLASVALYASLVSPGEAALASAEVLATLSASERKRRAG